MLTKINEITGMHDNDNPTETKKEDPASNTCESCSGDVNVDDALRLPCTSGHLLCGECSGIYAESVLPALMQAGTPPKPKCAVCHAPYNPVAFERILNKDQMEQWMNCVAMHTLGEGEKLFGCVSCNYFEVRTDCPPIFYCKSPVCEVVHCVPCKVMIETPLPGEGDYLAMYNFQQKLEEHLSCGNMIEEKRAFEEVLAGGNGRSCPNCGLFGRKDNMCTHMLCGECNTKWCYCCGLSEEDCDKAPVSETGDPIFKHNDDWQTNSKRCPMYLSHLKDVDEAWDLEYDSIKQNEDGEYYVDEEVVEGLCLDKFHAWLTLCKLKEFKSSIGDEKWKNLRAFHTSVDSCGFSDAEIDQAADFPLFQRQIP